MSQEDTTMDVTSKVLLLTFYIVVLLPPSYAIVNYTTESTSTTFSVYLNNATSSWLDDCICGCSSSNSTSVDAEIAAIFEKLYLDATTTSQYRRKRTSAEDHRPSAQGIGYSGIICLVCACLFFFLSDILNFGMFFTKKTPPLPANTEKQS